MVNDDEGTMVIDNRAVDTGWGGTGWYFVSITPDVDMGVLLWVVNLLQAYDELRTMHDERRKAICSGV